MSKLKNYATLLALIIGLISISTQTARAGSLFEMMNDLLGTLISTNNNAAGSPACVNNPVVFDGSDNGEGSLRQAVIDACPGSTITFSNTILNTGDAVNKISLVSGQITIDKNLTIQGPGATELEINSNGNRSFQISGGATATISGVTITGGGISNSGNLTVADSLISKSPAFQGGGIYSNGNLTVINSTIASNHARDGAGLYLNSGNTTLTNTTVSDNEAFGQFGGGIYNTGGNILTITSSTIVNNRIITNRNIYYGGGIYNESGTVNIRNSILAGNNGLFAKDFYGTLTSQGYNLIGTQPASPSLGTITGDTTGNIVGTNSNPVKASLAMLTFYGGETSTHALLSDSPAVNAGDPGISMPDQRGAARIGRPDMGAFEVNNSQNGGNFVAVLPVGLTENLYQFILMNPYERYPGNNNTAPTKYQVTGGALPSGFELQVIDPTLTIDNTPVDGYLWIKGLTNTGGDFNFTITATDNGRSFVTDYSLRILVEPPPPGECIVNPVVIHTANNGAGSLRRAVRDACPDSTITFRDNLSGVILIKSGSIAINKNLTIQGPGAGRLTLQKSNAFEGEAPAPPGETGPPALYINGGITAAISGLTITGINYRGPDTKGIENYGNLTLTDTNISFFSTGVSSHSNLNINKSIITNHYRGGIFQSGASLTINDTEISDNHNLIRGGGIWCGSGALNINNSNISKNRANFGSGGGLFIDRSCNATVTNTTISHNVNGASSITHGGGGIKVSSGTLTVTNSTIVNNISVASSASSHLGNYGGGIGNGSTNSFEAGIVSVRNSIIAGNISQGTTPSIKNQNGPDFYGPMTSQGYNLIGKSKDATITGDTTGNIVGTIDNPINPQITPYGFHGGSSRMHALFSNSPAVNAGDPGLSTPDQRGAARVGRADIGAFELNNAANGGSFVAVLPDGSPQNYYEYKLVKYDIPLRIEVIGSYDTTTYELTSGALPPGITLTTTPPVYDSSRLISQGFVVLSGTTSVSGIYNFSITATDGGSSTVTDYSVRFGTSNPNPIPTITPTPTVTPTPTPAPPSPYGSFDLADCSAISGWAWDPQQPNTPISVNIYADDNLVATVSADQFRQDLLDAGIGNGVHGFSIATPEFLKDGQPHQIRVRIVSTSSEIDNSPQSFTCESPTPTPTPTPTATPTPTPTPVPPYGSFDAANCSSIAGWAWDPQQPNTPISVNIYADDNLVATVSADQFRQDLLDAGIGNGVHGFSLATPESLRDGQSHQIRVRIVSTMAEIDNSPKTITCAAPSDLTVTKSHTGDFTQGDNGRTYSIVVNNSGGTATSGAVSITDSLPTGLTATAISGTGWNCDLSSLTCSRNDALSSGSSYPAITLTVNVASNAPTSVINTVQASGGGETNTANNSASDQTTINVAPLRGSFDSADCSTIAGWAWDPQQPNTPISVNIYADDNLVATVSADQFRQDLLDAGIGNGVHGFSLATPESLKDGQPHQIRVRIASTLTEINDSPKTITCAAPRYSVSGSVFYGSTDAGQTGSTVSGVRLDVTGAVSTELFTDSFGNYFISDLLEGNYTFTPSKTGNVRGIDSNDATRIQQHLVGLTTLSANQLIAADTDGNGSVNSLDATRIQQSLIGMQTSNIIGQWKFTPVSRQYNSLNSNLSGENYLAILVGEVSGNWASAASFAENSPNEEESLPESDDRSQTAERFVGDLFGQIGENANRSSESSIKESPTEMLGVGVRVSMPSDAMDGSGSTVTIPVTIGDIPPGDPPLESFDFSVFYDPAILQPATLAGSNSETLSANCSVLSHSPVSGRVIVSGSCVQAITVGSAVLYKLTFNVIGSANQTTNLTFRNPSNNDNTFQFNNGSPYTDPINGHFLVLPVLAANASVSGRVLTPDGRGLMNAVVVLTDMNGAARSVRTNPFGYYRFDDVEVAQTYIFNVKSKSYSFAPQAVTVMDDLTELNFTALE